MPHVLKPELVIINAVLPDLPGLYSVAVREGNIIAVDLQRDNAPAVAAGVATEDAGGRLVLPGFVDSHVHLDKSCLMSCCQGPGDGLKGAIEAVSRAKGSFTMDDVYCRGAKTLEKAILQGTTHMRTHVEVDPRVGLRSFEAIKALKQDYAYAIDLSICVYPQEGLTNDPGTESLLLEALDNGADLIGGCPYTDSDPQAQIDRLFDIATERNIDIDFHLDFDIDPKGALLFEICRQTTSRSWQGRVTIGHVTKLSAMDEQAFQEAANCLTTSGVAVTALPATDLYLNGRNHSFNTPRGIAPVHRLVSQYNAQASLATNNVLNPFTPFGDCSLLRIANLYANAMHVGPKEFGLCLELVTYQPSRIMRLPDYGIHPGASADLIILDATDTCSALAEISPVIAAFKKGRLLFRRTLPTLCKPTH